MSAMISDADNERIIEAIRAAEAKTSGEIYCVIARACGEHHLVPIAWAALVAFGVPLPLIYLTNWPAGLIYLLQLATFIVLAVLLSLPVFRFHIVPRRRLHGRAHLVAMQQFLAQGIHLTERRTGRADFRVRRRTLCGDRRRPGNQRESEPRRVDRRHRCDGFRDQAGTTWRWVCCGHRVVRGAARPAFPTWRAQPERVT